jgi:hypothetical protein
VSDLPTLSLASVCATVRLHGFHRWPDAPMAVGHLRDRHRHLFTVRLWAPVQHDDRDIEFQLLQRAALSALLDLYPLAHCGHATEIELGTDSCEHVARKLVMRLGGGGVQLSAIEVWEDDENGARLEVARG